MKKSAKRSKDAQENLPELVTIMTKLVERLEALEKKTDLVISRIAALPAELRQGSQNAPRLAPVQQTFPQNSSPRERVMYQAVCADCCKSCELPFKPSAERPVYCKACFAIRKAGHVPQSPDRGSQLPPEKRVMPALHPMEPPVPASKNKKQKPLKKSVAKPPKKKK